MYSLSHIGSLRIFLRQKRIQPELYRPSEEEETALALEEGRRDGRGAPHWRGQWKRPVPDQTRILFDFYYTPSFPCPAPLSPSPRHYPFPLSRDYREVSGITGYHGNCTVADARHIGSCIVALIFLVIRTRLILISDDFSVSLPRGANFVTVTFFLC